MVGANTDLVDLPRQQRLEQKEQSEFSFVVAASNAAHVCLITPAKECSYSGREVVSWPYHRGVLWIL